MDLIALHFQASSPEPMKLEAQSRNQMDAHSAGLVVVVDIV
jgi:hypothetical protein